MISRAIGGFLRLVKELVCLLFVAFIAAFLYSVHVSATSASERVAARQQAEREEAKAKQQPAIVVQASPVPVPTKKP